MNNAQRIVKNIGMSGISQALISIVGFILLIYIARYLGVEEYGKYSFALSFTALFVVFADMGISQLMIREIARKKELSREYITNASVIKFILIFVTFALIALTINLMHYPSDMVIIVYLFGIYTILTSFSTMLMSIFQAFEKMEYTALVMIIEKIALISLVLYILFNGYGLLQIAIAYVIVGVLNVILSSVIVFKKFTRPAQKINFTSGRALIKNSLPFAANSLFGVLFFQIDTVLLSLFKNEVAVGIYNAAYNPLLALSTIISNMVASAIYPVMSKYFIGTEDSIGKLTFLSSKYMAIIGFPIAVGCLVLSSQFIEFFYGNQYFEAILVFQILALFIPIRLVSIIAGTLLTSINKQGIRTFDVFLSAVFNIALNIILIPYLSYIGATIATVLSELFLYSLFLRSINKHYKNLKILRTFIRPIIASITMGVIIFYLKEINLFFLIILAALIYFLVLFLLKTFTDEDKYIIKQIINRGFG